MYAIKDLCDLLQCSRSGYYAWLKRRAILTAKDATDEQLLSTIRKEHAKHKFFGYRRVTTTVCKRFVQRVNHKRVHRLMRENGLLSCIRRKRYPILKYTTQAVSNNLLQRDFHADRPYQKLVTDITVMQVRGQKYYLSVIQDLFNNEILAYSHGPHVDMTLVAQTVDRLLARGIDLNGAILHSDQGSHYTSILFSRLLEQHGIAQSMSRKGSPLDNAPVESFFGHLKCETLYSQRFTSVKELPAAIEKYIFFYNHERPQKRLQNKAPVEYINER